ncbi:hypothetical protein, partial [Pantoea sp. CTOTU49201]|uniref:hypothetical protein n=1 Tax=Pantoea sp. CTOTU49201 TaxID=2953855 RepID=UPI00289B6C22
CGKENAGHKQLAGHFFKFMILLVIVGLALRRDEINFLCAAMQFPDCRPPLLLLLIYYLRS